MKSFSFDHSKQKPTARQNATARPKRMSRSALVVGAVVATTLALAGCQPATSSGEAGERVLNLTGQLTSNNPALNSQPDLYAVSLSYSAFLHMNVDGSITPDLATEWGYADGDNTAFDLTLRDGVTFADGTEVTAEGVSAWLNYLAFEAPSPYTAALGKISAVEATGPLTIRITLDETNPALADALSDQSPTGYVASQKCVEDPTLFDSDPTICGSGQYVIVPSATTSGSLWTYTPNEKYYDQSKINFDAVTVRAVTTPTTAFQALQTGQLNVVTVLGSSSTLVDQAKSAGYTVYTGAPTFAMILALDVDGAVAEPLGNLKVRQAINYALDREAIAAAAEATAEPTSQLVSTDGYVKELDTFYTYDPDKARALLKEAGYADGFTLSNVVAPSFIPSFEAVAQVVASQLSEVGITVEYNYATTMAGYQQAVVTTTDAPMVLTGQQPANSMWFQYAVSNPRSNHFGGSGWTDPELETLFQSALVAETPEDAAKIWQEMSTRIVEQADFAPIFTTSGIMYSADNIKGIELSLPHALALPIEWSIG